MKPPARFRWLILATIFMFGSIHGRADESDADAQPGTAAAPVTDPDRVAKHYREVLARPQFHDTGAAEMNPRIEDMLSQWFKRLGNKIGDFKYASQMPAFESLLMTLLVVVSISALLYIMAGLTRRHGWMELEPFSGIQGQKTYRPPEAYDDEIKEAIRKSDWHAAWLAAWRQFLSRLEYRHLVHADRTRTNREYLAQLRGKALPAHALSLLTAMVDAYDRFIYGRIPISESEWGLFHQQINEASLLLHLEDKKATALNERTAP